MNEAAKKSGQLPESYSPRIKPEIISMAQHAAFTTDTVSDPFMGGEPPRTSNRILNYRRLQNWENYFLASAICSVAVAAGADEEELKTIGNEKVNNGFHFFSAITGDMFTVLYSAETPCDSGVTNYFFVPQVVKKAYRAFGYDCVYLSGAQIKKDFRAAMNAIKASVDKEIPVLAWGMGNIPEGCLIGGYDEGDLLYANLYLGPERIEVDGDGYTSVTDGLRTTKGLFFIGNKTELPDPREIYAGAVEGIPSFLAMPPVDGYTFGRSAFETWADTLLDESRFSGRSDDELQGVCWNIHCSPFCNICTSAADQYIRAAAEVYDIAPAKKLLPLYERFIGLRQEIWALHGDFFPPMDKFRSPEFRAQIAGILRKMGEVCDLILAVFD